jgi:hypothetical protein
LLQSALAVRKGSLTSNPYVKYELLSYPIMDYEETGGILSVKGSRGGGESRERKGDKGRKGDAKQSEGKGSAKSKEEEELTRKKSMAAKKSWEKRKAKEGKGEKNEVEVSD